MAASAEDQRVSQALRGPNNNASSIFSNRNQAAASTAREPPTPLATNCVSISSISVPFPHGRRPFPQQLGVMSKVILAAQRSQNALLESPTGTGKTIALLSSSLAWQRAERVAATDRLFQSKRAEYDAAREAGDQPASSSSASSEHVDLAYEEDEDGGDFEIAFTKRTKTEMTESDPLQTSASSSASRSASAAPGAELSPLPTHEEIEKMIETTPKVIYCSRTHSQLAQVAKELKRINPALLRQAPYTVNQPEVTNRAVPRLRSVVLASRELYCVNRAVSALKGAAKNDACRTAVMLKVTETNGTSRARSGEDNGGFRARGSEDDTDPLSKIQPCGYYKQREIQAHAAAWASKLADVEELAKLGTDHAVCPYFVAREAVKKADIIFMPYNYILDPGTRESMGLNPYISGSLVIIDEAHNVEDISCSSASFEQPLDMIRSATKSFRDLVHDIDVKKLRAENAVGVRRELALVAHTLDLFCAWAESHVRKLKEEAIKTNEPSSYVVDGHRAIAEWENLELHITEYEASMFSESLKAINQANRSEPTPQNKENPNVAGFIQSSALNLAESLAVPLVYMVQLSGAHTQDFRVALLFDPNSSSARDAKPVSKSRHFASKSAPATVNGIDPTSPAGVVFNIWCLNPSLAFKTLRDMARSVVLTSGTLAPLDAMCSELGSDFRHLLEAGHVADLSKQLFARSLSHTPSGHLLDATYKNAKNPAYLDNLGEALLQCVAAIPKGVLCFFPSYASMERCRHHWIRTSLWDRLQDVKHVLMEAKQSGEEFERDLNSYRRLCSSSKGALYFAVLRGKLSEGVDFPDDAARGVIVMGIPFPAVRDVQVELKRKHQDARVARRSSAQACDGPRILTGSEWYSQQAFRALNQALGRCLRHRDDYGAIILLEQRFTRPTNVNQLSKWLRGNVRAAGNLDEIIEGLGSFFPQAEADFALKAPSKVEQLRRADDSAPSRKTPRLESPADRPRPFVSPATTSAPPPPRRFVSPATTSVPPPPRPFISPPMASVPLPPAPLDELMNSQFTDTKKKSHARAPVIVDLYDTDDFE